MGYGTRGDLSSLRWLQRSLVKRDNDAHVRIHYSAINFRDAMFASGKLSEKDFNVSYLADQNFLGTEFSGIVASTGKRVMGMHFPGGCFASHINTDASFLWDVPPNWTLEEAATVGLVYSTVYACFFVQTKIEHGKKILIHSGTGGIGLAAIRTALCYGLEVFTTVGSQKKRDYLMNRFPELEASHIGNSRDLSFYEMIMLETDGAGVDYVLNSLSDDKFQTSLQCLARNGIFMEIGKYDIMKDTKIGLGLFAKQVTMKAVALDEIARTGTPEMKAYIHEIVAKDIERGFIVPIETTVYPAGQIEEALRFITTGKHIGKILLKVRENDSAEETLPIQVHPRIYCNPAMSYILPGGLGGFGLELADWLILRGGRKIVLSSSRGVSSSYQQYRIG